MGGETGEGRRRERWRRDGGRYKAQGCCGRKRRESGKMRREKNRERVKEGGTERGIERGKKKTNSERVPFFEYPLIIAIIMMETAIIATESKPAIITAIIEVLVHHKAKGIVQVPRVKALVVT